jgi:predicted TIM-barrel fold metal-dependent hydrolase
MSAIDCCVRASASSDADIVGFLSDGWREYVAAHVDQGWHDHFLGLAPRPDRQLRGSPIDVAAEYRNPLGDACGPDDLDGLRSHLDRNDVDTALICPSDKLVFAAGLPTVNVAVAATRAINDWLFAEWVEREPRLRGVVLVPTQVPEAAADEIRRWAGHRAVGGILLSAGGLAKPFGHPVYRPIHEAAHEAGLPIVLLAGGDAVVDSGAYPVAGGFPGTYAELRTLAHQSLQSHIASLIGLGVLRRHPSLRVLALGGGILWLAPWLWRLDVNYRAFRYDVVWLEGEPPSAVFKRHFLVGTHPFVQAVGRESFHRYLRADPDLGRTICFASGYPDWACTTAEEVVADLPQEWTGVLRANAEGIVRRAAAVAG